MEGRYVRKREMSLSLKGPGKIKLPRSDLGKGKKHKGRSCVEKKKIFNSGKEGPVTKLR